MAITRIYQSGYETGSIGEIDTWRETAPTIETSPYTGTYSIRTRDTSINASNVIINISNTKQIRVGMFSNGWPNTGGLYENIRVRCSSNDIDIDFNSIGGIGLVVKGSLVDTWDEFPQGWKHIGIDVKKDSVNGWAYVYINGELAMSFEGDTGNEDITQFWFGKIYSANYDVTLYWDDVYIDDTTGESIPTEPPPILRFYYITPNANGNYAQWDGSDGNKTDNYQLVDEVPPSTSDYTETISGGLYDSYGMSTLTLQAGQTIEALIPISYTQRTETTEEIALGTRYSSTDLIGSAQNPPLASWGYLRERQTTKPGGGAWDQVSLDGVEFVITSSGVF